VANRSEVAEHCRDLASRGLAIAGAGNVSTRVGDSVLITRGGLRFETATEDDITVVTLEGEVIQGQRPSAETDLHLRIYRTTPAGAVVHTHGGFSVAVGLTRDSVPPVHYAIRRLGGHVPTVPYLLFGSPELAAAVGDAVAAGARAVLLRNHGAVACGNDLAEATENAEMVEWLCEVYLRAQRLGEPALLTAEDLAAVADQAQRIAYGARQPASHAPARADVL
jgi:L-fuculose-phosphate aldolase